MGLRRVWDTVVRPRHGLGTAQPRRHVAPGPWITGPLQGAITGASSPGRFARVSLLADERYHELLVLPMLLAYSNTSLLRGSPSKAPVEATRR